MIQRPITASTHLYRNIKQLVPPVSKLLARHGDSSSSSSSSSSSNSHSRSLSSGTMTAAASANDTSASSNAHVATSSSSSSQVVIYDSEVLKRTIRGVVFDMDGTLTVPVIDFQYMRQVGSRGCCPHSLLHNQPPSQVVVCVLEGHGIAARTGS